MTKIYHTYENEMCDTIIRKPYIVKCKKSKISSMLKLDNSVMYRSSLSLRESTWLEAFANRLHSLVMMLATLLLVASASSLVAADPTPIVLWHGMGIYLPYLTSLSITLFKATHVVLQPQWDPLWTASRKRFLECTCTLWNWDRTLFRLRCHFLLTLSTFVSWSHSGSREGIPCQYEWRDRRNLCKDRCRSQTRGRFQCYRIVSRRTIPVCSSLRYSGRIESFRRAVAQRCPNPPMKNLVTLGGQHQGVYGKTI